MSLISEARNTPLIVFARQLSPVEGEAPEIVSFWDGSLSAHGACVYLRWQLPAGPAFVRLVAAKCRVAPLVGATVQRMELQGLTTCARLTYKVVNALNFVVRSVTVVGDSMCCLMALRHDGVHFNAYFQHRLCEVQEHLEKLRALVEVLYPVHWVQSSLNPADMLTKPGTRPEDMGPGCTWQCGPAFLREDRECWPILIPDVEGAIPAGEVRKGAVVNLAEQGQVGARGGAGGGPPNPPPRDTCTPHTGV